MKINLLWTAVIAELKFIKSLMETETAEVTKIVKTIIIVLVLVNAVLAAATIQG